jgi:diacylglycerol kinase family enzyme
MTPTMTLRPRKPVLIINPRSGDGKAARDHLATQCRARGIEPMVFEPGDDVATLAATAVNDGADALGMAGGDGSQAAVTAEHDLPYVCVPAGTRNHFALDLGIDRHDVIGALDAFVDGSERSIDLGRVNGRVFVNNVAMGGYGAVVQAPVYREHKVRTVIEMVPELIGPDAEPFDLRYIGPDGRTLDTAALVLVSNDPYAIDPPTRPGTRRDLDGGVLGAIAVSRPPPQGLTEWSTPTFRVDSATTIALGIDGESVAVQPPLVFASNPRALRVLVPVRRSRPRLASRRPPRPSKRRSPQPGPQS